MTRQRAKELLEVITAYAEGKEVQIRLKSNKNWTTSSDTDDLSFGEQFEYRIKPTTKYRPWKPEEVPVGVLVMHKDAKIWKRSIIAIYGNKVAIPHMTSILLYSIDELYSEYNYSTDNGKTWNPCGVLVEE